MTLNNNFEFLSSATSLVFNSVFTFTTPLPIPQTKEGRQSPAWGAWGIYSFSRIFKIYQINLNKYGIFILISEYL